MYPVSGYTIHDFEFLDPTDKLAIIIKQDNNENDWLVLFNMVDGTYETIQFQRTYSSYNQAGEGEMLNRLKYFADG